MRIHLHRKRIHPLGLLFKQDRGSYIPWESYSEYEGSTHFRPEDSYVYKGLEASSIYMGTRPGQPAGFRPVTDGLLHTR